ncbi:MAG: hypothetical protein O2905_05375 [Proteobacteria bacterium]|nr:hypothetical protein [Pseudomonadota bacterium]
MRHRYSQPLHLKHLTEDQLNKLLANWSKRTGSTLPVDVAAVKQRASGLPIYALLAMATQGSVDGAHTALDEFAKRSRRKLIDGGLDEDVVPVVALASLTRGLGWEAANAYRPELRDKPDIKPTLDRLFATDCAGSIPAIRPDILAGYFVLAEFQKLNESHRQAFLDAAWEAAPNRVARTLMLIHRDFPEHEALPSLDRLPEHAAARLWWGRVRVWLIAELDITGGERHWAMLRDTAAAHPDDADLTLAMAEGAVNAINRYGEEKRWDEMTQAFHALRQVAERHPDDTDIQLELAGGTVNAVSRYGEGQRWDDMASALAELRQVAERHPDNTDIQIRLANGAVNAVGRFGDGQRWDDMASALAELRQVAERHPDNTDIQLILAEGAFNAATSYGEGQRWDEMASALAELRQVAERHPDNTDIQLTLAKGAVNAVVRFGDGQRWDDMAEALAELRQVAERHPDHADIQLELAKGAVNAILGYGDGHRPDEMTRALGDARGALARVPESPEIQNIVRRGEAAVRRFGAGRTGA